MDQDRELAKRRFFQHFDAVFKRAFFILQGDPEFDAHGSVGDRLFKLLLPVGILGIQIGKKIESASVFAGLFRRITVGETERLR
jgi:hypothetical protein